MREESRCAARTWTEEGQKRAKGAHSFVRSFVPSFLAYRSRGPGRTILLDLCARAIARSSRGAPLPKATSACATTILFAKIIRIVSLLNPTYSSLTC